MAAGGEEVCFCFLCMKGERRRLRIKLCLAPDDSQTPWMSECTFTAGGGGGGH